MVTCKMPVMQVIPIPIRIMPLPFARRNHHRFRHVGVRRYFLPAIWNAENHHRFFFTTTFRAPSGRADALTGTRLTTAFFTGVTKDVGFSFVAGTRFFTSISS